MYENVFQSKREANVFILDTLVNAYVAVELEALFPEEICQRHPLFYVNLTEDGPDLQWSHKPGEQLDFIQSKEFKAAFPTIKKRMNQMYTGHAWKFISVALSVAGKSSLDDYLTGKVEGVSLYP